VSTTSYFAHESAYVDESAQMGESTKIWHFCHVMTGATIGRGCNIGQNVVVSPHVVVGDNVKIQNNVSLYTGVTLEDFVFCGPSIVFTNVLHPRAEVSRKDEYAAEDADKVHYMSFVTQEAWSPRGSCLTTGGLCASATATMRNSFLRVPPKHEYAVLTETNNEFDRFGLFRSHQPTYARGGADKAAEAGIAIIGEAPRPGAGGCRVAFLHPRTTGGVLIELSEKPRSA